MHRRAGHSQSAPRPWAGNECDAAFFDLPLKPAELLKRLRQKFTVEDLRRAGVVTVGAKKTVRLSPQLAKNPRYILALRRAAGEKPHDLVAGSSSLRNRTLCSLLQDHHVQEMLESTGQQLAVVTTPEDLAVLISAGIPAAPAGAFHFNDLRGPRLNWFRKMLRLREWGCGSGNAEHQAAAPSPTNGAVEESPGTTGSPATAAPQAAADDRDDEFAKAGGAEDRADDPGDEAAEAERGEHLADELEDEGAEAAEVEDRADDPGDECAAADKVKNLAREMADEFDEGADWPATGEGEDPAADFEAQQREWAEAAARMEERLRDNSIGLVLVNWSPWQLELGEVPQILEARECLRVVDELGRLALDNFGVWSLSPARLKRFRFSVGQRERTGSADILRQPRRGLFTAGLFGDRFAAGARDVCRGFPRMLRLLSRPGFRSVLGREVEAGAEVPAGGMGRVDLERGARNARRPRAKFALRIGQLEWGAASGALAAGAMSQTAADLNAAGGRAGYPKSN